jgi:hypothetical protein
MTNNLFHTESGFPDRNISLDFAPDDKRRATRAQSK